MVNGFEQREKAAPHSGKPRICVCGSINMDLVVSTPRIPSPGETLLAHSLKEVSGGKGANQAVAAARLGANVSMVGRVGSDGFSVYLKNQLQHEGIDVRSVLTSPGASGVAIVTVDDRGENAIMVISGANGQLTVDDIDAADATIEQCDCVLIQLESPIEAIVRAIELGKRHGKLVLLNPAPAPRTLDERLLNVDVFCPNQTETELLLGQPIRSIDDALAAAQQLRARGPAAVVITLGSQGAVLCEKTGCQHLPPIKIQSVDTTAAGDAFMGALAFRMGQGAPLSQAASFACAAGAWAATQPGAQPSLPTMEQVLELKSKTS